MGRDMCMKKKPPFTNANMVRRQFYIARDQAEFLKTMCKATDRSRAHIVREALRQYAAGMGVELDPEPEE
jgi:Ribbon-helix-helix protein, copG family